MAVDGWTRTPLGNLIQLQKGASYKGEFLDKAGPRLLGMGTIVLGGGLSLENARTYSGPIAPRQRVCPGDLLIAVVGISPKGSVIGSPALVPSAVSGEFATTHHVARVEVRFPARLVATFLYYLFRSTKFQNYVRAVQVGSTVPEIKFADIYAYEALLPPISQQNEIAEFLGKLDIDVQSNGGREVRAGLFRALGFLTDQLICGHFSLPQANAWLDSNHGRIVSLDDKIELNRRMNQTLEEICRALFKFWFVDFGPVHAKAEGRWKKGESLPGMPADMWDLWPTEFEESEIGEIPKGWKLRSLAEAADVSQGSTPSTENDDYWDPPVQDWVTVKDLSRSREQVLSRTERKVSRKGLEYLGSKVVPAGSILLSTGAPVGYVAISAIPLALGTRVASLQPHDPLGHAYTYHWVRASVGALRDAANGTTFPQLLLSTLREFPILVPPAHLLSRFESLLSPAGARVVANQAENYVLAETRDALLPKLLSGEIRVKVDS